MLRNIFPVYYIFFAIILLFSFNLHAKNIQTLSEKSEVKIEVIQFVEPYKASPEEIKGESFLGFLIAGFALLGGVIAFLMLLNQNKEIINSSSEQNFK